MESYYEDLLSLVNSTTSILDTSTLQIAIQDFKTAAAEIEAQGKRAISTNDSELLTLVNHKFRDFQRGFVSQGGLPNREFYRHLIFAPGLDTGMFPVFSWLPVEPNSS